MCVNFISIVIDMGSVINYWTRRWLSGVRERLLNHFLVVKSKQSFTSWTKNWQRSGERNGIYSNWAKLSCLSLSPRRIVKLPPFTDDWSAEGNQINSIEQRVSDASLWQRGGNIVLFSISSFKLAKLSHKKFTTHQLTVQPREFVARRELFSFDWIHLFIVQW